MRRMREARWAALSVTHVEWLGVAVLSMNWAPDTLRTCGELRAGAVLFRMRIANAVRTYILNGYGDYRARSNLTLVTLTHHRW